MERLQLSFARLADDLTGAEDVGSPSETEQSLLIEEVKIGCTFGMLQCLDRPHRMAYILGEIMDLPGPEAAEVLGISPELLRKRLQHARAAILSFTKQYCGLASDSAPCKCNQQLPNAIRLGKMNGSCNFAASPSSFQQIKAMVREVEETRWALQVHRSSRPRASSTDFARSLLDALQLHKA